MPTNRPPKQRESECPVCGSRAVSGWLARDGYRYALCADCTHGALDPCPSADLEAFYESDYFIDSRHGGYANYLDDEPLHRRNARLQLARIRRCGGSQGRFLDVGCAVGFLMDEAHRAGYDVQGVDISDWARQVVHERFGYSTHQSLAHAARAESAPFSVVCISQVLEHMADPLEALRQARRLVGDRGRVFIETWDRCHWIARMLGAHWQQVTPPSVIHLYSRQSLARHLKSAGFGPPSIRRGRKNVSLGFVASLLASKYPRAPLLGTAVHLGKRVTLPYAFADLIHVAASPAA